MATANGICGTTLERGAIVLMARIVDGGGGAIRPLDVRAIHYSVYEVDPFLPEQLTAVRGHRAIPLAVGDVLFESPQVGRSWSVDDVGYNFRHEIRLGGEPLLPKIVRRYEVAYRMTMLHGCRTSVRFLLRHCACDLAGGG